MKPGKLGGTQVLDFFFASHLMAGGTLYMTKIGWIRGFNSTKIRKVNLF